MYKKIILAIVTAIAAAGCTSIAKQTNVSTRLAASEFNSASSTYEERPTFVSLQTYSSGVVALVIDMDEYGMGKGAQFGADVPGDYLMLFDIGQVPAYLPLFDKYFEWEELARTRGDTIDREIGSAPGAGYNGPVSMKFSLHSGNATSHYLVLELCAVGVCNNRMVFDSKNARELRSLLVQAQSGKIQHLNADEIYK